MADFEELAYIWERDFDGGRDVHANAEDMEAIRQYMIRNGYAEAYDEEGRTFFFDGRC